MINRSKKSIILVGYAMQYNGNEEIFESLKTAAIERNVKIKIIFDKATTPKKWGTWTNSPKRIILKSWGSAKPLPIIYSYDHPHSSLHAKFMIVDDIDIFVTSANMTGRVMKQNLEIGIRHHGQTARDLVEVINLLIHNDIIQKIQDEA